MEALLESAKRDRLDRFSSRLQVPCADGSMRWSDTRHTLLWSEVGDLDGMILSLRDVTDLVAIQQEMADHSVAESHDSADAELIEPVDNWRPPLLSR